MKRKERQKGKVALLLVAALLLGGCGKTQDTSNETEQEAEVMDAKENEKDQEQAVDQTADQVQDTQSTSDDAALIADLKKKYSAADKSEYDGNVIKVDRDQSIQIEIGYNPWDTDISLSESFIIYQDADLKFPVEVGSYEYDPDAGTLTIEPPFYGIAEMDDSDDVDISHLSGNYLSGDDLNGWGTLPQYYMQTCVDLETGKKLPSPVITVIKVNSEIAQAPQVVFDQTEEGYARFSWKQVEGAEGYLLFRINKDEEGLWDYGYAFADVKETQWSSESEAFESDYDDSILALNYRFQQFYTSDDFATYVEESDSFLKDYMIEEEYGEYYTEYYGVLAYNAKGCSPISNLLSAKDLAHMLPTEKAGHSNEESFFDIEGVMDLPAVMCVTMCDGSTAQKVLQYDFDSVLKDEEYNCVRIKAKALQTPFTEEFAAYEVNWDTLDADLAALKERQEKLINKGGSVAPSLTVDDNSTSKEDTQKEEPAEEKPAQEEPTGEDAEQSGVTEKEEPEESKDTKGKTEIKVTANSALSEYIALNMLETNEQIDLSAFPEAADTQQVVDAFFEAQYQNPLILGIRGGSIDTEKRILYVEYDFDQAVTAEKQQKIQQRVLEITEEIISADMTDLEKEMAINSWLCENAVYDDAALENAEKYSFTQVDEDFYDSFTAYGILADGVGVCASYSAAFKLLADAAGLESIVVTGYLDGSCPHAWNKVKIDDDWYIVDATNNDNDLIENALLNLSDSAAYGTLVEDDGFALDSSLSAYAAVEDDREYYHTTDRFYDTDVVSDELAQLLLTDGEAVLRTDYDIDDEEFYEIAQQAADKSEKNISGFYWMGVIHLEE